jgi:Eco57I restriction-modification methylase
MDAVELLSRIRKLPDLMALIRALGHDCAWQELPPDALPVPVRTAAVLGRAGNFEWVAVLGGPAAIVAERLSAALARSGRLAGVLALDGAARQLAIGITVERTTIAILPLDHPQPAARERLRRLLELPQSTGLAFALRASEILHGEDLGRRFFLAFRDALEQMAEALPASVRNGDRRSLALIQLTRVLFLYFVQAKGWLDGRSDFLRQTVDEALARRRRLHRDLFRPLFFGTLNRRPEERGRARGFGRIPFLNGGLFEPHPLERAWRGDIPNLAWREAFDRVFERFHFTVREGEDPARIAPDMLGRVFEGLMAPADRRESGAFYTPAMLVQRVVNSGLEALLTERLDIQPEDVCARLSAPDATVAQLLRDLTILDPAVGSGAFLLGALERLAQLREGEARPAVLRRRILERNLFGVDLSPMAVRLAELRLWLAVLAVEDSEAPEMVAPLPNLNGVVRQGDSLLDPSWALAGLGARPIHTAAELRDTRRAFVLASGPGKRELARRLRHAECRALAECLRQAENRLERDIAECLEAARTPTLFGERRGLDHQLRARLRLLRERAREARRLSRRLRRSGEVPWFSYDVHFGDVLALGGFDLVVGNPPWVRAEQIPSTARKSLGTRFRWWRSNGPGFRHQPDLAVAFVERSAELLAPTGALALLLPAKFATAGYARAMRAELATRFTVHAVADLTEDPAASFAATTYPAALIVARRSPRPGHEVRLTLETPGAPLVPQQRLQGGGPWLLLPAPLLEALAVAQGSHPKLGQQFTPQLGVKTGANAVFLDPPADIETALIRQAIRGRDLQPFRAEPRVRLFFPHAADGAPFRRLPAGAARHVERHDLLLRARVDFQGGPPWTLFRLRGALAPQLVVWPDLARRLTAAALLPARAGQFIPLNSCYVLPVPDPPTALALSAWLNSTWIRAIARATADVAAGGFARFNARVVAELPLPASVLTDRELACLAERGGAGENVQEELDAVCAEHLALPSGVRELLANSARADSGHRGGRPYRRR